MKHPFFPQRPASKPIIYAYSDTRFPQMLKVGYTERSIEERMKEHYPTLTSSLPSKARGREAKKRVPPAEATAVKINPVVRPQNVYW